MTLLWRAAGTTKRTAEEEDHLPERRGSSFEESLPDLLTQSREVASGPARVLKLQDKAMGTTASVGVHERAGCPESTPDNGRSRT